MDHAQSLVEGDEDHVIRDLLPRNEEPHEEKDGALRHQTSQIRQWVGKGLFLYILYIHIQNNKKK